MMLRLHLAAAAFLLLTAACGREKGAPSAEQNRELDQAAEMLDQAPNALAEIDDGELVADRDRHNQEGEVTLNR